MNLNSVSTPQIGITGTSYKGFFVILVIIIIAWLIRRYYNSRDPETT